MNTAAIWITGATDDGSIIVHGLPGTEVCNRRVRLQRHERERLAWDQETQKKRALLATWDHRRLVAFVEHCQKPQAPHTRLSPNASG